MKIQGWIGWLHVVSLLHSNCGAFQHRSLLKRLNPERFRYTATTAATIATSDAWSCNAKSTRLFYEPNKKLEILAQKQVSDKQVDELLRNYGEKSRLYRRDVFTSADWIRYRRPDRFIDHILTIYDSGLIRGLRLELLVLTTLSTFIVLYNDIFVNGIQGWNGQIAYGPILHLPALQLPLIPFTLSTAALGLLLTFRTNVSYSRWNEARTAWGAVINDSRSIVRMGCIWATSYTQIDDASLVRLGDAVCSFSRTLMNRTLPPQEDAERFLQYTHTQLHDQGYAQILRRAKHRPSAALAELTQILVEYQLNPIHQVEVERIITSLCNSLGACERIFSSPVPIFYTRHTARFLVVWLFCLPLGMYDAFGSTWNHAGLIPACFGLGLFLMGIEELATQMEEPFSILPMEKMCEGSIRTPIMEQVQRSVGSERAMVSFESTLPSTMVTSWVSSIPTGSVTSLSDTSSAAFSESPVDVLSKQFGIDFAVDGIDVITTTSTRISTTSSTGASSKTTDDNEDDDLGSFFVAQPLSYNPFPDAAPKHYKSSSFMPQSYKSTTGSGIGSYVDALPGRGRDVTSSFSSVSAEDNHPSSSYPDESTAEPTLSVWNYGGMPSASIPSSKALSSYMPKSSSYKEKSSSGIPSYFDNMHNGYSNDHQQYTSDSTPDLNGHHPDALSAPPSEPLRYGGIPSATSSWKPSPSSYMPKSSYKATGSGLPSYFDHFNAGFSNSPEEVYPEPPNSTPTTEHREENPSTSTNPPTSGPWKKASYMPKSYRPTSGSGMPSYFDNF